MGKELATPELAAYYRAAIKMLDFEVLGEEHLVKFVEEGRNNFVKPVQKLRELTPLEAECVLLDVSLSAAAFAKLAEASVFYGGRPPASERVKITHAMCLIKAAVSFISTLLAQEEDYARKTGVFPKEKSDKVCLEICNDALCIYAGRSLSDSQKTMAERIAENFDLGAWQPVTGKMN